MKRDSLSVVAACFAGALIGSFISLEIAARFENGQYFWVVGALIGGLIAYTAVDFERFRTGVKRAWTETAAWRPEALFWKALGLTLLAWVAFLSTPALVVFLAAPGAGQTLKDFSFLRGLTGILSSFAMLLSFIGMMGAMQHFPWKSESMEGHRHELADWADGAKTLALYLNPIGLAVLLLRGLYLVLLGLYKAPIWVPIAFKFGWATLKALAYFSRLAFIYIHSARRTLCFVDAAIGAGIGFFAGSSIIGGLLGALLGLANYELVSIRLLKLKPR